MTVGAIEGWGGRASFCRSAVPMDAFQSHGWVPVLPLTPPVLSSGTGIAVLGYNFKCSISEK